MITGDIKNKVDQTRTKLPS